MVGDVTTAVNFARQVERVRFSDDGLALWNQAYPKLTVERLGLLGALTARAEAHTVRLALLYALLDQSREITEDHLRAALAVWNYCDASVQYLFGNKLGHPIADPILTALRQAPNGVTRTAIVNLFNRNARADKIDAALEELVRSGLVYSQQESKSVGAPVTTWFATELNAGPTK